MIDEILRGTRKGTPVTQFRNSRTIKSRFTTTLTRRRVSSWKAFPRDARNTSYPRDTLDASVLLFFFFFFPPVESAAIYCFSSKQKTFYLSFLRRMTLKRNEIQFLQFFPVVKSIPFFLSYSFGKIGKFNRKIQHVQIFSFKQYSK